MPGGAAQRGQSQFIVFENFEKMDTQSARQGLSERALAWQENLQAIAPNKLVTVPAAAAAALASFTDTTLSLFEATLSGTDYIIRFSTSGAGYGINVATGAVNNFAPPGTFTAPDVTTWQASRVLIQDPVRAYSTWDGNIFIQQGNVSPVFNITSGGSGYSSAPPVTISGGSGTGATAHSVISGGSVVAVVLDNPGTGYKFGDTLTVTFGTGVGSGAAGHVTMTGFPLASIGVAVGGVFNAPTTGDHPLAFSGGSPSVDATAVAHVVAAGSPGTFTVVSVGITSQGSGYQSAPTATLPTSGGTPPSFNVFLGTENVASIVLDAGGTGYVAPPNVSIQGGGGSGAAAHATISGGAVNALILDNGGSGYTSTPSVFIGTGSGAAATAHIWPIVGGGASLAVFQGRVWLANGNLGLQWTGTQGFDDFAAANGSGITNITDADLVHKITAIRAANNYLFILGDQSVKQIGNITISGSVTLFTILTLSSDQGTTYPLSCASYNRVFTFANKSGVYAVLGSSVQKISDDLDGIWSGVDFSQQPQAALIDLNSQHMLGYLVRYADPFTGTTRSLILTFNGKRWFVIAQGESLDAIVSVATLASALHQPYGSSGTDLTQLLADSTRAVSFRLQTALSAHGNVVQGKKMIRAGFAFNLASGTGTITQKVETETTSQSASRTLKSGFHMFGYADGVDLSGVYLGQTLSGTLAGLTLNMAAIEFNETMLWPQK